MPNINNNPVLSRPVQSCTSISTISGEFAESKIVRAGNAPSSMARQNLTLSDNNSSKNRIKQLLKADTSNSTSFEIKRLIGKSISPEVAEKTKKFIIYDGRGVICGFKTNKLTQATYHLLVAGITTPLTELNQKGVNTFRTPSAALIDITNLTEKHDFQDKEIFMADLKNLYLSGEATPGSLGDKLEILKFRTKGDLPELYNAIERVISSISKKFHITLHNDNLYGRFFDSSLAKFVVEHPSKNIETAKSILAHEIVSDFNSYSPSERMRICSDVADRMRMDPQPWRANIPEAQRFIKTESPEDFIRMLNTNSDYSALLITLTTVKYILAQPAGFSKLLQQATKLYSNIISTQRNLSRIENSIERSSRYGINLHYQKAAFDSDTKGLGPGVRPIDRYQTNASSISTHDQLALKSERAIGIGMSGSTNILNFALQRITQKNPDFPIEDAKLMVATALTFSGGHSINEAYTVFGYRDNKNFVPTTYSAMMKKGELYSSAINHAYRSLLSFANRLNT